MLEVDRHLRFAVVMGNSNNIELDTDEENVDCLQNCAVPSEDSEDIARSIVESEEWPSYIEQLRKAGGEDDDLACKPSSTSRYVTWRTRELHLVNKSLISEAENGDLLKLEDAYPAAESAVRETSNELIKGLLSTSVGPAAVANAEEPVSPLQLPRTKVGSPPVNKAVRRCFTSSFPDYPDECLSSSRAASPLKSGQYKVTPWGTPPEGSVVQHSGSRRSLKGFRFGSPHKQVALVSTERPALRRSLALLSLSELSESPLSNDRYTSPFVPTSGNNLRDGATSGPRTPGTSSSVFTPVKQLDSACSDVTGSKSPSYAKKVLEWSKDVEQFRAALASSGSSGDYDLVKSSFRISKSGSSFMALEHFFMVDNVSKPGATDQERPPMPRLNSTNGTPNLAKPSAASRITNVELSPRDESSRKNLPLKRLGRGAFGRVFGVQIKGRLVAVKDVRNVDDPAEKNGMHLVHRHVVRTLHITQLEPRRFLVVMEYGGPQTLQNMLDDGRLQLLDTLRYGRQIASALHYCHRCNILHLDVKPSNILMKDRECKLADFGSSAVRGTKPKVCGTVQYMAPEALCGQRPDYACDIYSLGIVLWQMYSGQRPFDGLHQHAIIFQVVREKRRPPFPEDAPVDFQELVNRCWTTAEQERPTTSTVVKDLNVLHKAILLVRNAPG